MKWLAIAVLAILLISGCAQQGGANSDVNANTGANAGGNADSGTSDNTQGTVDTGMAASAGVASGDTIKVEYIGKLEDGAVFDKSEGRGPLEFVAGAGQMIK